ncbi:splicing factor 45 [Condylostylus longicornis]|uniref:splicing factor 45 n=1 Tax=Condylostylus longicornis TaxID=2530218 RepID=UPI00244DACEC|nr:splicing factor 45 [Condylostylus longicornis]
MDLYDDLDTKKQLDGWSSGIKMLQTQLAIKKATLPPPKKEVPKKPSLMPTVTLSRPKKVEDLFSNSDHIKKPEVKKSQVQVTVPVGQLPPAEITNEWDFVDEYNPLWPNEYEKLVKDKRDRDRERDKRDDYHRDRRKRISKPHEDSPPVKLSGFAGRSNDEDSYEKSPPSATPSRTSGVAIAPPPSLQESTAIIPEKLELSNANVTTPYGTSSVAAKIMAKYGFKDGQGLGKQEQGMSIALQVEKTSKRGGRIIHEKELFIPPLPPPSPPAPAPAVIEPPKPEPSITEIMKSPSKVVLLRNMVGPGDVDAELEPEVKDECNTKYGDVVSVAIHEVPGATPDEAVRIFVEFKRIESAIKAVVDLNGRFFGGRQVKAGFYDFDKFKSGQINY